MGSGKQVDFEFNNSKTETAYGLGYVNPYFTQDGVSLGMGGHYRKRESSDAVSSYSFDSLSANLDLGLPTSEYERLFLGFEPQHMSQVECGSSALSTQCESLKTVEGDSFTVLELTARWSRDSRNRAVFPDQGSYQRFSAQLGAPGGVEFFKVGYRHDFFYPITDTYTLLLKGDIGLGDGYGDQETLPFFTRYYGGGEGSVRGFETNSIGPQDGNNDALGGGIKAVVNAEIILPIPFLEDVKSTRVSGFVDAGTVSNTEEFGDAVDYARASAGVSAKWISPVGPLSFSWATPLKKKSGDDLESFQFRLGQMF